MGLQKQVENKLTPSQKSVLAKLNAIRNFQLDPLNSKISSLLDFNPPPSEQVSVFDYLKKIIESTLGSATLDLYLKTFLDKLFDPSNNKLEMMVIKAMAKTLDANGVNIGASNGALSSIQSGFSNLATLQSASAGSTLSNINNPTGTIASGLSGGSVTGLINTTTGSTSTSTTAFGSLAGSSNTSGTTSTSQSNEEWLTQHVLPLLHTAFSVAKAEIVKQIITMVFGPKEKMSNDPTQQSYLINAAVCSSDMFSMSNPTSDSDGDFEFNKVELKKRLENGEVVFIISCQEVKIKLPETIINQANDIIVNNSNPSKPKINPAVMFEQVNNTVTAEAQRINAPENANAIKKNFAEIMVEKVINLLTVAIEPYTKIIFATAAISSGSPDNTVSTFSPSPCDIRTMCSSGDSAEFQKKTAFNKALMNSILAYLISIMLQKLIKEIKKIIKNYILKKSQDAIKRKLAKRAFISDEQLQKLEKAKKFAEAAKSLSDIFKYTA